jgi:hypothetical protein
MLNDKIYKEILKIIVEIYKEILKIYKNKSIKLFNKLQKKLLIDNDPLKIIEYIDKILTHIYLQIKQKTITFRLIIHTIVNIEKKYTKKYMLGGNTIGAPYMSLANGDNLDRYSGETHKDYGQIDFVNNLAKIGMNIDTPKMEGGANIPLINILSKIIKIHVKHSDRNIDKKSLYIISNYIYLKIIKFKC